MSCYFVIDTYIDESRGRGMYDEYIEKVKPIVEKYGGTYLVRTEKVTSLHPLRSPQRIIIIEFPDRKSLNACFSSDEYKKFPGQGPEVLMPGLSLRKDDFEWKGGRWEIGISKPKEL